MIFLISWIIGIILSMITLISSWIDKDKGLFESGVYMFLCMLLTGWITAIPILLGILIRGIMSRFDKK